MLLWLYHGITVGEPTEEADTAVPARRKRYLLSNGRITYDFAEVRRDLEQQRKAAEETLEKKPRSRKQRKKVQAEQRAARKEIARIDNELRGLLLDAEQMALAGQLAAFEQQQVLESQRQALAVDKLTQQHREDEEILVIALTI